MNDITVDLKLNWVDIRRYIPCIVSEWGTWNSL